MVLKINNIKISVDEKRSLEFFVAKKLKTNIENIKQLKILKKATDARDKTNICFVYNILVFLIKEVCIDNNADVSIETEVMSANRNQAKAKNNIKPLIVGMGPCGIFAALTFLKAGITPIIIERGEDVETRVEKVNTFFNQHKLDTDSNIQFGEGGAGTFSDGKLNSGISNLSINDVLAEFVRFGASSEIMYENKPHIGTDVLRKVVKNIREEIIKLGGTVLFKHKLTSIKTKDGKVVSVGIQFKEKHLEIKANTIILAIGHSARDTIKMLYENQVQMQAKPFSIGVRIEHSQESINKSQYGKFFSHPSLGPADYKLSHHLKNGRTVYSFCMCPGGFVVNAASEENMIATNGMSNFRRDGKNANSALLVSVTPQDFGESALAGIEFQRKYEMAAYNLSNSYLAPVQLVGDFLNNKKSTKLGQVTPSIKSGYIFAELKNCLPDFVIDGLKQGIMAFDNKIKNFATSDAVLCGVETRSSSPVRILRDENFESNIKGLYPAGEGAGFAGGIMSSAIDGIKIAQKIIEGLK